jgi:uncharacterized membrane protein
MSAFVQWVHVTAAVVLVGGMVCLFFVLEPSLQELLPEQRQPFLNQVLQHFRWLTVPAILLLLVSGIYSVRQYYWEAAWGKSWVFLTLKIVLAFFVFIIALGLTLPFRFLERHQARRALWLAVGIGLAVGVLLISAYLRR